MYDRRKSLLRLAWVRRCVCVLLTCLLTVGSLAEEVPFGGADEAAPSAESQTEEGASEPLSLDVVLAGEADLEEILPEDLDDTSSENPAGNEAVLETVTEDHPATDEPADDPTPAPVTEAPTVPPTEEPTPVPVTEAPTEAPTDAPIVDPVVPDDPILEEIAEPVMEPAEQDTAEEITPVNDPWDESVCDHANPHCEQAPACLVDGCPHILSDIHQLDQPVCALGRWLLDRQDALGMEQVHEHQLDVSLSDCVLYRSGSYVIQGRGGRVEVAPNRKAELVLHDAAVSEIRLENGSSVTVKTRGSCSVERLTLAGGNAVVLCGSGAASIGSVAVLPETRSQIRVTGGSWKANGFQEAEGRQLFCFPAAGTSAATVNGEAIAYTQSDADGQAYLYLPLPGENQVYVSSIEGSTLVIRSTSSSDTTTVPVTTAPPTDGTETPGTAVPPTTPTPDPPPDVTEEPIQRMVILYGGEICAVSGDQTGYVYIITAGNVTLDLQGVQLDVSQLQATVPYTLHVSEPSVISGEATLSHAVIDAEAELQLLCGTDASVTFASGTVRLSQIPEGYAATDLVPEGMNRIQLNGAVCPCLILTDGTRLLPALGEGEFYQGAVWTDADGELLVLTVVRDGMTFSQSVLQDGFVLPPLSSATITGDGRSIEGQLTVQNQTATVSFSNVQVHHPEYVLRLENASLTAVFSGDNALTSVGTVTEMTGENTLSMTALSGRLLLQQEAFLPGMTLKGNIKLVPEPEQPHTVLQVVSRTGQPVANRPLTVWIGETSYEWITHYDGTLSLWNIPIEGELSASDGQETYRVLVRDDTPPLQITGITVSDTDGGVMEISYDCADAATSGVSYIVAQQERDLPDTYVERARIAYGANGKVRLKDIQAGMMVTFRVFASRGENQQLNAGTSEDFAFSELRRHVHRAAYTLPDTLNRTYTGKPYELPVQLPEGAEVRYAGEHLTDTGLPVEVGDYTVIVRIPENHPVYFAGRTEAQFAIEHIQLTVLPEPNQEKYMGEEDPELFYTVTGLLEGDAVTGILGREPGEEAGNYAFDISGLEAPDAYRIVLSEDAPSFTVLPNWDEIPEYPSFFSSVGEDLHPVTQEITRSDGRKLSVTLQSDDTLKIGDSTIGRLVYDTKGNKNRIFTPSLGWDEDHETLLLRLRTEPELNRDKGYVTDSSGNPVWGGSYMQLNWQSLEHLSRLGVDAVSLVHAGASLTISVDGLLSSGMSRLAREHNWTLAETTYRVIVVPNSSLSDSILEKRPLTDGWTMGIYMGNGRENIDVTDRVDNLLAAIDLEPVATLMDSVGRYDAMTFGNQLGMVTGTDPGQVLKSTYVQPATPEESEVCDYVRLMYNHRYLMTKLEANDTLYCVHLEN